MEKDQTSFAASFFAGGSFGAVERSEDKPGGQDGLEAALGGRSDRKG